MALRLSDLVIAGEILNTRNYSTHGWIRLRGRERPLMIQLTGNCDEDLRGRHFRFEAAGADEMSDEDVDFDFSGIAWQQIGPTGTITAERKVKVADCPPEELYRRSKLGEPPPMQWKRCLTLEWYSQNGRVLIELVDPVLEFVDDAEDDDEPEDGLSAEADASAADEDLSGPGFSDGMPDFDDEDDEEDPWGLFPSDLRQQFEDDAAELDRAIGNESDSSPSVREMELMDELIESGEGDIIGTIFDDPLKLPRPEQLSDEQVEPVLKSLLGQLALYGIALDVCEHFTPRDCYRLLLERICTEERAYPQLKDTQWVQHFMTCEFCDACEAEMDREYEEYERRRSETGEDDFDNDAG